MSKNRRDIELIREAIKATGSTNVGDISLYLEDKFAKEMEKWKSKKKYTIGHVYDRMRRYGIYTTSDIERLIKEATE